MLSVYKSAPYLLSVSGGIHSVITVVWQGGHFLCIDFCVLCPRRPSAVGWNDKSEPGREIPADLKCLYLKNSSRNDSWRDHLMHELSCWCSAVLWNRPWLPSTKAWTLRFLWYVAHYFVFFVVLCFGTNKGTSLQRVTTHSFSKNYYKTVTFSSWHYFLLWSIKMTKFCLLSTFTRYVIQGWTVHVPLFAQL